ncbi:MAG: hypothetical protein DRQ45_00060 [Gammaproteobacteria bacterium]|nr:MAG: hypothetical protein DRQ45_00060 [Gammaproteobacteria bacterium]
MANAWEHPSVIASEALMHLEDSLVITNLASRDKTSEFDTGSMKVGDTINMRTNPDYEAKEFTNDGVSTIVTQDIRSSTRPFQIEKLFDVSVDITSREKALDLDSFSDQVIIPAIYRIAEQCDKYVGTKILDAAGLYASATLLGDAADVAQARKAATLQQLDMNRHCLVNTDLEATLLGQTWFNQSQTRGSAGESTLSSGNMGHVMGMDFSTSINFPSLTRAASSGTTQTDSTVATNNVIGLKVLTVDSVTGGFTAGDRISVAGVRRPLIVASNVSAAATTIPLVDPISEIIPDNAAITVIGSGQTYSAQGAIFDGRSLAVAMPSLGTPSDKPSFVAASNGYSIRVVQGYDITKKVETMSLDLMMGAVAWDPRKITLLADY